MIRRKIDCYTVFLCGLAVVSMTVLWTERAWSEPMPNTPDRRQEAELFATQTGDTLRSTPELTEQTFNDLAAIRRAYPLMNAIDYVPPYALDHIMVLFNAGIDPEAGLAALAGLNESLGLIDTIPVFGGRIALIFDEGYNLRVLASLYEQQAVVADVFLDFRIRGDGGSISRTEPSFYTFSLRWGDCPSGCMYGESWSFLVKEGQVTPLFSGPLEWPDNLPLPQIPEPQTASFLLLAWGASLSRYRRARSR